MRVVRKRLKHLEELIRFPTRLDIVGVNFQVNISLMITFNKLHTNNKSLWYIRHSYRLEEMEEVPPLHLSVILLVSLLQITELEIRHQIIHLQWCMRKAHAAVGLPRFVAVVLTAVSLCPTVRPNRIISLRVSKRESKLRRTRKTHIGNSSRTLKIRESILMIWHQKNWFFVKRKLFYNFGHLITKMSIR